MNLRIRSLITTFLAFFLLSFLPSAVHAQESVTVSDFSNPVWESYIRNEIDEYNAVLPATAPQLVYERMEMRECPGVGRPEGFPIPLGITLCYNPLAEHRSMIYGQMRAFIFMPSDTRTRPEDYLCHEFMHAVTEIKDRPAETPLRTDSCVWGISPDLGSFDIEYINEVYAVHPVDGAQHKNRKHKKHRRHRQARADSFLSHTALL